MTGTTLLLYISTAFILQVLLLALMGFRQYRQAARHPTANSQPMTPQASGAAWSGWRDFRVVRRVHEDLQHSQCSFYLAPADGIQLPAFKPGQFLTFQLDTPSQTLTRCYSLSDKPSPQNYRVTIKRQSPPRGSQGDIPGSASCYFHDAVNDGDIVHVRAPSGAFYLDPDPTHDIVLIAGGIGITPMLSMLNWCLDKQPLRNIHMYYGLRSSDEHVFKMQLTQLAITHPSFQLTVAYSQPKPGDVLGRDYQNHGHVDLNLIKATLPNGNHQFYICGPPPMMQSLVPALAAWGVALADIRFEAFGPASIRTVNSSADGLQPAYPNFEYQLFEVQFLDSARTLAWTAAEGSLLDFADKNGIVLASGCRAGSCGTCETKLISGSVRYADKPDYDFAAGYCLPCVGMPTSNLILAA